jgi:hypothetical protein
LGGRKAAVQSGKAAKRQRGNEAKRLKDWSRECDLKDASEGFC